MDKQAQMQQCSVRKFPQYLPAETGKQQIGHSLLRNSFLCGDTALMRKVSMSWKRGWISRDSSGVFLELMRRNEEVFYWKSEKGREVDFVIKKGLKIKKAIQVALSLSDKRVKDREIQALADATEDEEGKEIISDSEIRILPIWKRLLTPD